MSSATSYSDINLLGKWYPHVKTPFIANGPMYGFTDARMAAAVTSAGGYGM
jgi:nitronate monooxygenase